MKSATVSTFIDKFHPKKNGECAISIRVTHNGDRKYYPIDKWITLQDWNSMQTKPNRMQKKLLQDIQLFETKAVGIVKELTVFTFGLFEERYLSNVEASDSVSNAFDTYISELRNSRRIGTAITAECAKKSLETYKNGLCFADVTVKFLEQYQRWMIDEGRSETTVGIYLRSLRTIFNRAKVDKSLYPFGSAMKQLFEIPVGGNTKKALNLTDVGKIYHHKIEPNTTKSMARDYWIFMYLCNGINVKDMCLLKHKNLKGNTITYQRSKTKRTKKQLQEIIISLKPEAKEIISKWGQTSISPESYLFPHLKKGMSAEVERATYQQLTKTINKYMKRIANEVGIDKEVTTYYARHSFATILKNSGVGIEFIGEALGHSDSKTTQSYLKGFEEEQIHSTTDVLLKFKK